MEVTHNAREAWLARAQMDKDVWTHPALCWNGSQFAVNADVPEGSDLVRLSPAYLKRECPIAADPLQLISKLAASQRIRELPLDFEPPREGDAVLKQLDGSIFAPRLNVNARMIATSDTPRAVMHYICRSQRLDGGKCYAILTGIDYFDHRSGGAVVGGTTKQGIFLRTFRALKAGEPVYHDYFAAAHVNCVQTAVQYGFVDLEDENIAIPNSVTICLPNPLRGACLPCTLWRTLQDRALRARVTFSGEQMSVKGSPTDLKRNGISPTFAQLIKLLFPTPLEQLMFLLHTHKGLRDLWDKQRKICQPTLLEAGSDNPRLRSAIARCFVVAEDCIASLARLVQHTITSNNLPHHPVRALSRAKPTPVTLFAELAASASFVHKEWGQTPVLYRTQQGIADIFTMDDLAVATDNNLLPLAQFFGRREGGDQLASSGVWRAAGADRGTGFYGFANISLVQTKYLRFDEVEEALLKGSIVYNCAGATHPKLGSLCLTAMDSFDLPVQANLYVTGKGIATSATPHSDKQNVLVLQSRGAKHWRVFAPPPPFAKPAADPLARGKLDDTLRTDELGEPLIDVVLKPGDCLYVPAGFPHTTDTVHVTGAGAAAAEASVHITLGVATNLWGLSYADARSGALSRTGQPDTLTPTALQPALYWLLMRAPSSLGFFRQHQREHERACAGLVRASRLAETARWENMSDAEVSSRLDAPQIIAQLERHRERIVSIHRKMHLGAVRHQRVAPSDPGLSIARVETYKKELEAAHQEHLQWFKSQPEAATAGQEAEAAEAGDQQAEPPPYRRSGSSSPSRRSSGKSVRWWDERD